jgi:RNA-binding protein 26
VRTERSSFWTFKRADQRRHNSSDADSDVLADYVLALLRHDQGADEVKQLCVDQLDDFLKERL